MTCNVYSAYSVYSVYVYSDLLLNILLGGSGVLVSSHWMPYMAHSSLLTFSSKLYNVYNVYNVYSVYSVYSVYNTSFLTFLFL